MADALSDQLSAAQLGGSASAGLAGSSLQISAAEDASAIRIKHFSFTIPASGAGSVAGDRVKLANLNVFDRIYAIRAYFPAMGSGTTYSLGKIDSNNAANTDNAHYSAPISTVASAIVDGDVNMCEQVGVAPTGAATDTGDKAVGSAPGGGYGNGPITITATVAGTPTAAAQFQGYILYARGAA